MFNPSLKMEIDIKITLFVTIAVFWTRFLCVKKKKKDKKLEQQNETDLCLKVI